MKRYSGILNRVTVKKFLSDFYGFYASAKTKVTVAPDKTHENFNVVLEPEESSSGILEAFLNDYAKKCRGQLPKLEKITA